MPFNLLYITQSTKDESMIKEKKEKLINFRPLCIAAAFFAVGIACAFFAFYSAIVKCLLCTGIIVLVSAVCVIFSENKIRSLSILAVFVIIFSLGFGYSSAKMSVAKSAIAPQGRVRLSATVERITATNNGTLRVVFRDCRTAARSLDGKAVAYIATDDDFEAGDRVSFFCYASNRENEGDYYYDVFCGIYYSLSYVSDLKTYGNDARLYERANVALKNVLKKGLDDKTYPLAIALTLGDASLIGEKISAYRFAGIAHAFAVSGLHVGLFFGLFVFIADKLKLRKIPRIIFVLLPTAFYCLLCGFRPSAIRALIMASTALLSRELGFKRDGLSVVAVALIVVLCIQPFYLFDAGMRLSFLAVGGITLHTPVLKRGAKPLKSWADPLCVTAGASLGTLPVLVDMSGYMSLISVFANLIFVPILALTYQIIMICSVFAIAEYVIWGSSVVSMFLPSALLSIISSAVDFFDFSLFAFPVRFGFSAFFYYAGLFFMCDLANLSVKSKAIISCSAFALCVLVILFLI